MDPDRGKDYEHALFYDFHIYEAEVRLMYINGCSCMTPDKQTCKGLHTEAEGRFYIFGNADFPRQRLPKLLPVVVSDEQKEYAVNIYDPQLADIVFVSRLHQTEGKEVFGTIEARITGFLLDFLTEEVWEKVYEKTEQGAIA